MRRFGRQAAGCWLQPQWPAWRAWVWPPGRGFLGGFARSSPAVARGVVYVGSADDKVYAINAATGAELWAFPTGGIINSSPAVANGTLYIGSENGTVKAFGLTSGLATPTRPNQDTLQPDYNLPWQDRHVRSALARPAGEPNPSART